ncbi:hypothetical protein [Streptomyces europaeiscabiei]|uniref:hypothetical protein n=1 Tax=Streptomyces europaeiscabiei TaxID=146819 RepID=UPI0038F767AF
MPTETPQAEGTAAVARHSPLHLVLPRGRSRPLQRCFRPPGPLHWSRVCSGRDGVKRLHEPAGPLLHAAALPSACRCTNA